MSESLLPVPLYWFLDIQTTGGACATDAITELAWTGLLSRHDLSLMHEAQIPLPFIFSRFVALPGDFCWRRGVKRRWTELSGLSLGDLEGAPSVSEVWAELVASLKQSVKLHGCTSHEDTLHQVTRLGLQVPVFCVAHFAAFEERFLRHGLGVRLDSFPMLCTHQLARERLPQLPSKSLRAVAGHFGHFLGPLKRAEDHVAATVRAAAGLLTLGCYEPLVKAPKLRPPAANNKNRAPRHLSSHLRDVRLQLPSMPGVYRFIGPQDVTLYVGKANDLKARVNSYFRGRQSKGHRLHEMLSVAKDIGYVTATSGLAAVALESLLIKDLNPPYNRLGRNLQRCLMTDVMLGGPVVGDANVVWIVGVLRQLMQADKNSPIRPELLEGWSLVQQDALRLLGRPLASREDSIQALTRDLMAYARLMIRERRNEEAESGCDDDADDEEGEDDEVDEEGSDGDVSDTGGAQNLPGSLSTTSCVTHTRAGGGSQPQLGAPGFKTGPMSQTASNDTAPAVQALSPPVWLTEASAESLTAAEWAAFLPAAIRRVLRLCIRARHIHRLANSDVTLRNLAGSAGVSLAMRRGLPKMDRLGLETHDAVFAAWIEQKRPVLLRPMSGGAHLLDLYSWDCCSALLGEIGRLESAGQRVTISLRSVPKARRGRQAPGI